MGIFHSGSGDKRIPHDRRVVVSVCGDGLDHVLDLAGPLSASPWRCRPWYCRQDHPPPATIEGVEGGSDRRRGYRNAAASSGAGNGRTATEADGPTAPTRSDATASARYVEEATEKGRRSIEAMIDQPGRCLRNAHDSINFLELDGRDLSTVTPPMGMGTRWALVDTAEKMADCAKEIEVSDMNCSLKFLLFFF